MKIVFVPNYFYLNLPIFEPVIIQLAKKGITSYVLHLPGNTDIPADKDFDSSYFRSKGIKFIEIPIIRVPYYRYNIYSNFKLLAVIFKNWKIVQKFPREFNPDVVVVGSDLGNLNIRFLMDVCYSLRIPVVILYTCDLSDVNARINFRFFYSWRNRYLFRLRILNFLRACLFTGTIPGEYTLDSTVCVASKEICQRLVAKGINRDRIIVTGMPFLSSPTSHSSEDTFKKLGIPKNYKVVVLFTECIQNIYGTKYTEELYVELIKAIEDLSEDVFFIIKLHPLEDGEMETFIRDIFNDKPRCKIINNFNVEELIGVADLCMAHFSRVLITAALMHKRFLSINLMKDRKRTFISGEEAEILEIGSYENLEKKVKEALEIPAFGERMDKMVANIANRFFSANSYEKIISVILNKVDRT